MIDKIIITIGFMAALILCGMLFCIDASPLLVVVPMAAWLALFSIVAERGRI